MSQSGRSIIQFSYVGFRWQEVTVGAQKIVSVNMSEDYSWWTKSLSSVMVREERWCHQFYRQCQEWKLRKKVPYRMPVSWYKVRLPGSTLPCLVVTRSASTQIMLRGISSFKGGTTPVDPCGWCSGSFDHRRSGRHRIDPRFEGWFNRDLWLAATNGVIIITTKTSQKEMPPTIDGPRLRFPLPLRQDTRSTTAKQLLVNKWAEGYLLRCRLPGSLVLIRTGWRNHPHRYQPRTEPSPHIRGGSKQTNYTASVNILKNSYIHQSDDDVLPVVSISTSRCLMTNWHWMIGIVEVRRTIRTVSYVCLSWSFYHNPNGTDQGQDGIWFSTWDRSHDNPVAYIRETLRRQTNRYPVSPWRTLPVRCHPRSKLLSRTRVNPVSAVTIRHTTTYLLQRTRCQYCVLYPVM